MSNKWTSITILKELHNKVRIMAINEGLSTGELLGKMIMEYKQKPRPGITYFIDDDLKEMNSIKQKKGTKK
jgi:hypothetical protein